MGLQIPTTRLLGESFKVLIKRILPLAHEFSYIVTVTMHVRFLVNDYYDDGIPL